MDVPQQSMLSDLDFTTFKRKVKASFGLDLEAYKRPQMERRLRANMERHGAGTFMEYYGLISSNAGLLDDFLDRVTINVSELFRSPECFQVLEKKVMPEILRKRSFMTVWSAGCSYGAEPYSLAILLEEQHPGGIDSVLATDIDDRMLARARDGVFQEQEVRNVSPGRLLRYFDRTPEGYTARDTIRKKITFKKHDLLNDPFRAGFDLIVCRNVVIYFTDDTKTALYTRFFDALRPGGYLFVGGTERMAGHADIGYENECAFFYKKPIAH